MSGIFTHSMKRGKFAVPSVKWFDECDITENMFFKFHSPNGLKKGSLIRKDFIELLQKKFPHRPLKLLSRLVAMRTDIRKNLINLNVKTKKKKKATRRARRKTADF